jgi:hypothetical protein
MKRSPRWAVMIAAWIVLMAELILPQSASAMRIRLPDIAPYPVDDIGDPDGSSGGRMYRVPLGEYAVSAIATPLGPTLIVYKVRAHRSRACHTSVQRGQTGR